MHAEEIIDELKQSGKLAIQSVQEIEEDSNLRRELIKYFARNNNRELVIALLEIFTALRRDPNAGISGDSLMLACFILATHNQIEDCIKIWETKCIDFDTYCYVDIQLVVFAGLHETVDYLQKQTSEEAKSALEYIIGCAEAGDFDDLEKYFQEYPWFV